MDENSMKKDTAIEFAKERTFLASENTMMAWVRTSLTLIGFGIGIYEAFEKSGGSATFRNSRVVALSMILLGVAALFLAINQSKKTRKNLMEENFSYKAKKSLSINVAYGLIIIGIIGIIHILVNL